MDFAIKQFGDGGFDIEQQGFGVAGESGLRTAVIISLFTDRRANDDDVIPDGSNDRRGWWANPDIGSRLWLLSREKETQETFDRAVLYTREALQWLFDDGVALSVDVSGEWVRRGVLGLVVTIGLPDGGQFEDVFNYQLEAA